MIIIDSLDKKSKSLSPFNHRSIVEKQMTHLSMDCFIVRIGLLKKKNIEWREKREETYLIELLNNRPDTLSHDSPPIEKKISFNIIFTIEIAG